MRTSSTTSVFNMTKVTSEGDNYEEIVLKNLQKYTRYLVVVQAFNQMGEGPFSEPVTAQTLEDGKSFCAFSRRNRNKFPKSLYYRNILYVFQCQVYRRPMFCVRHSVRSLFRLPGNCRLLKRVTVYCKVIKYNTTL